MGFIIFFAPFHVECWRYLSQSILSYPLRPYCPFSFYDEIFSVFFFVKGRFPSLLKMIIKRNILTMTWDKQLNCHDIIRLIISLDLSLVLWYGNGRFWGNLYVDSSCLCWLFLYITVSFKLNRTSYVRYLPFVWTIRIEISGVQINDWIWV